MVYLHWTADPDHKLFQKSHAKNIIIAIPIAQVCYPRAFLLVFKQGTF